MKHFLCCLFFDCPSPPPGKTREVNFTRVFFGKAREFSRAAMFVTSSLFRARYGLIFTSLLQLDINKLVPIKLLTSLLQTCCQQPCYSIVTTTSLQVRQQVATSLSQQAGNKQCEHILLTSCWNSIATSLLRACYNLCVFMRVCK